jgi:hypothetical protein
VGNSLSGLDPGTVVAIVFCIMILIFIVSMIVQIRSGKT